MNVLIIEDEPVIAKALERMILDLKPDAVIHKTFQISDSVKYISNHDDIDYIFSDIRLSDGDVFSVFDVVETSAEIIFTTSYNQYAIKAFDYNCVSYLLKPVTIESLSAALHKCAKLPHSRMKDVDLSTKYRRKLIIESGDDSIIASVDSIVYIFTEQGNTKVHLDNGAWGTINVSLLQLIDGLDPGKFFRVNRQTIVNLSCIDRFSHGSGRESYIRMKSPYDNLRIPISQDRKNELINMLM